MRVQAACFALAAALFLTPAAAQKATEAESHVTSAFTSGADHGILAQNVALGPVLRRELGGETDSRRIYNLLIARTAGKAPSVTLLPPGEAASHAALPGVNAGEPMFRLAADGVVLLLQYATSQKHVTFVEQLGASTPRSEASAPAAEVSKPEVELPKAQAQEAAPVTSIPLPTEAPAPLAVPAPPPISVPTPAPVAPAPAAIPPAALAVPAAPAVKKPAPAPVVQKPQPSPVAVQKAPPPAPAPRGECVIKPVMSDEDMRNCAAPSASRAVPRETIAVQKPAESAPAVQTPKPRAECVIKPVMTDEELRICAAVSTSRSPVVETPAARRTAAPAQPAPEAPKAKPPCVIKAVMSDEELRACGSAR